MTFLELTHLCSEHFLKNTPKAQAIIDKLKALGEEIVNDHIALRTFNYKSTSLEHCSKELALIGATAALSNDHLYHFEEKKLRANYFYDQQEKSAPKIFVSEIEVEKLSKKAQEILAQAIAHIKGPLKIGHFLSGHRPWPCHFKEYQLLHQESEYAAWLYAFGFRANHITLNVNAMTRFKNLENLVDYLKQLDIPLNHSGGIIKGVKEQGLKQASTLAFQTPCCFEESTQQMPGGYLEMAQRFEIQGIIYQGFIPASADKIFESTHN